MLKAMAPPRIVRFAATKSGEVQLVGLILASVLLASPPMATSRPAAAAAAEVAATSRRQLRSDADSSPQPPAIATKSNSRQNFTSNIGSTTPERPTATVETTTNGICNCLGGCCCLLSMPDGNISAPSCSPWT
ncbi:hypothetical protein Vretimale_6282, partial [Volvox reticuliferus]